MRLAIADPPYPPQFSERNDRAEVRVVARSRATRYYSDDGVRSRDEHQADHHPNAADWDSPARHRQLLEQLVDEFDGWAIATTPDSLDHYRPLPIPAKLLVWHKTNAHPTSHRIASSLEVVIVYPPVGRRGRAAGGHQVPDLFSSAGHRIGFPGSKPPAWTRWVLDALGYDQDADELVDMFPGSGAVARAAAQLVLL